MQNQRIFVHIIFESRIRFFFFNFAFLKHAMTSARFFRTLFFQLLNRILLLFQFLWANRKKRPLLPKFPAQLKHKRITSISFYTMTLPLMIAIIMMTLSILLMLRPICCFCCYSFLSSFDCYLCFSAFGVNDFFSYAQVLKTEGCPCARASLRISCCCRLFACLLACFLCNFLNTWTLRFSSPPHRRLSLDPNEISLIAAKEEEKQKECQLFK